jgi:chemosensory pili system protein ChpA (sensor histidine kinase/response regulator)
VLDDAVKVIGPLCIDLELYNVFLNEADEWSRRLGNGLSEWGVSPTATLEPQWSALAHSLAGGAGTVGHAGLAQLARALEHALDRAMALQADGQALLPEDAASLLRAAEEARTLLHQFAAGFLKEPLPATLEALAAAAQVGVPVAPDTSPPDADHAASVPAEPMVDTLDRDLFVVFEDEAGELLPRLGAALRQWVARPDNTGARAEVLRNLHTLKGSARLAGALRLGELVHELESAVLKLPETPDSADTVRPLLGALDELVDRFDALRRVFKQAEAPHPAPEA